jgi:hypothetical protein
VDAPEIPKQPSEPKSARSSQSLRFKLATLVCSSIFSLTLVEILLRTFFASSFPWIQSEKNLMYRYDSRLGWFPIAGSSNQVTGSRTISVAHNRDGFRDIDHLEDGGKPRVLFIGDSFVWGYDVEMAERFTDKLRLKHPEWAIYNCGVSGYGTDQEYLLLQQCFDRYKPTFVFLVFCTGNDDVDNRWSFRCESYFKPYFTTNAHGLQLQGVPVPRSERSYFAGHPLLDQSYLLHLLARAYAHFRVPAARHVPSPTRAIITEMHNFLQTRGVPLAIGFTDSHQPLQDFLTQSGIPFLDLSNTNRYPIDRHWTAIGHDLVCAQIDTFLKLQNSLVRQSGVSAARPR